jgi:hypothetical protein
MGVRVSKGVGSAIADEIVGDHLFVDQEMNVERMFRVRWASFGEDEDSWMRLADVLPLACFEKYREEHRKEAWAVEVGGPSNGTRAKKAKRVRWAPAMKKLSVMAGRNPCANTAVEDEREEGTGVEAIGSGSEAVVDVDATGKLIPRGSVAPASDESGEEAVEIDQTGVLWPAGVILTMANEVAARKKLRRRYTGAGDDYCSNCGLGGELLQCDFCRRAFHVACMGMTTDEHPGETEDWICCYCAWKVWKVRV